jgi:hypothetical protein
MKSLSLLLLLALSLFLSCNEEKKEEAPASKTQEEMPMDNSSDNEDAMVEATETEVAPPSGIAEENNQCICTKDYNPVCGSNGVTYPNPCQAGCEKISEFTEGPCAEETEANEEE